MGFICHNPRCFLPLESSADAVICSECLCHQIHCIHCNRFVILDAVTCQRQQKIRVIRFRYNHRRCCITFPTIPLPINNIQANPSMNNDGCDVSDTDPMQPISPGVLRIDSRPPLFPRDIGDYDDKDDSDDEDDLVDGDTNTFGVLPIDPEPCPPMKPRDREDSDDEDDSDDDDDNVDSDTTNLGSEFEINDETCGEQLFEPIDHQNSAFDAPEKNIVADTDDNERDIDNACNKNNEEMWFRHSRFNTASQNYFHENHTQSLSFGGLRCLVYRCLYRTDKNNISATVILTTIVLHMVTLLSRMAAKDQDLLASLVAGLFLLFSTLIGTSPSVAPNLPPFPTTVKDLSKMMIGGRKSFWNQLPCEDVKIVDQHHVAITLDSVIDHMMAHGVPLSFMQDENGKRHTNGVNGSAAADALLEKLMKIVKENGHDPLKTAYGYLIFWSDGFMTSFVKQKDNGCWCMTVTVAPPNDNQRSIFHTHCISLGSKGGDHGKVMVAKLKELEEIRKGRWRYYGGKRKWIFTSFDIIVVMGDRPEGHDIQRTLSHSGLSSKRMRYAAYTDPAVLPSCDQCLGDMLHSIISDFDGQDGENRQCRKCCNWEYSDRPAWKKCAPRPKNYPETITDESRSSIEVPENREVGPTVQYIKPHEQTFSWLKHGVDLTMAEVSNGNWTKTHGHCYLQSLAVSNVEAKIMIEEAARRKKKRKARELYTQQDIIPTIWLMGYAMRDFIDCPMHCELHSFIGISVDFIIHLLFFLSLIVIIFILQ